MYHFEIKGPSGLSKGKADTLSSLLSALATSEDSDDVAVYDDTTNKNLFNGPVEEVRMQIEVAMKEGIP